MISIQTPEFLQQVPILEIIGYLGSLFTLIAYSMRNMRSLRIVALCSNVCSLSYGLLMGVWPMAVLHGALLPLNASRLIEIERAARRLRDNDLMDDPLTVLRPFLAPRDMPGGSVLFRRGDTPDLVFYLESGSVHLPEIDEVLEAGTLFGEMAYFGATKARTTSAVCREDCRLLSIDDATFMKLFNQHPEFGFYIVRLMASRLIAGSQKNAEVYSGLAGPPR